MLNFIKVKITFVSMLIFTLLIFNAVSLIAQKSLKIISPNGGEKLQANTWQGISWIYNDVDKINISYSVDGGNNWEVIERNINSEIGTISWKVPLLLNQNVKIKIEDTKGVIFDISDNYFTIIKEYSLKGSLQKISKINATYKILPLGNSITYDNRANDTRQVGDKKGYRDSLYNLLSNAGYNFVFKGSEHSGGNFLPAGYDNNAGFPGIKDDQLATLMKTGRRNQPQHGIDVQITPGPYLDIYPADIVLLHIGTNGNDAFDGTSADDVEEILDEIKRYEDSTNTSITVILARIIDRVPNATYVNTFNNNVEAMALDRVNNPSNDAYPDKIVMIDMQDSADIKYTIDPFGTIGNGITGDMSDYLHPNDKGYAKMAEVWFNAITEILPGKPVIVEQPKSKSTIENSSVNFDVSVTGTSPFSYQWQKNGSDISDATQAILTLENISALDDSSKIKCIVSNSYGSVTSKEATLYVTGENDRVTVGLQALYTFEENDGIIIFDKSNKIPVLNLEIEDTTKSKWIPYGIKLTEPNLISSILQPQRIYDVCTETNEITLEAWITPKNLTQTGPARIMTFSQDGDNRNFTLGQSGNKYSVRLRTTETNNNGQPELLTFS
ncbi:MAG: immunoglobulin domain-containing protein, partial [Ignavibacteriae bacterium]|nr:immunoglobulin domain-containing protein [Ignavibacteriota bacterium]